MKIVAIISLLLLVGCTTESRTIYLTRCPALVEYHQGLLDLAAMEITKMPLDAVLPILVADYAALREACRKGGG